MADVRRSIDALANRPDASPADAERWASVQAGIASLDVPTARRAALVFLGGRTNAKVCEDVALVADNASLARLTQQVQTSIAAVKTPQSDALSNDLQKRGFRFVGSTICYALMQATGMVNDHLVSCFRYKDLSGQRPGS